MELKYFHRIIYIGSIFVMAYHTRYKKEKIGNSYRFKQIHFECFRPYVNILFKYKTKRMIDFFYYSLYPV